MKNLITEEEKQRIKNLHNLQEGWLDELPGKLKSELSHFIEKFKGSADDIKKFFSNVTNTKDLENKIKDTSKNKSKKEYLGSDWAACKSFDSKGGLSKYDNYFDVTRSSSNYKLSYNGPSSGVDICHPSGGKDTIHQVFNVLICDLNPYLIDLQLKPDINNIKFESGKDGKNVKLSISIPLKKSDETYQIDRRGGLNHLGGKNEMESKCSKTDNCEDVVTHKVEGPFGSITEYFITYPV